MPARTFSGPADLAEIIAHHLTAVERPSVPFETLLDLVGTLFAVSLETEEGSSLVLTVALADPENPDPNAPPRIRSDRWTTTAFGERVPFTTANLAKLAMAADPRSSTITVYFDEDGLFIWGLSDQG